MRQFTICLKKEWTESIKSYKFLLIVSVFCLFGLLNVFTAKFTPQIISLVVSEELASVIPQPILSDIWIQFFKNVGQIGILLVLIIYSSTLTYEYEKGTLILPITKGLSRWKILISKWLIAIIVFTIGYLLSSGITFIYGLIYFSYEPIEHLILALGLLWLFTVLFITIMLFASVMIKQTSGVFFIMGLFFLAMMLLNVVPRIRAFNPVNLSLWPTPLIQQDISVLDTIQPIVVTLILIILLIYTSITQFNKKSL